MPITSFKKEWIEIKRNYETATGKKKPSAKLAGAWKNASGLEPACADLDAALSKRDAAAADKACDTLESLGSTYNKVLAQVSVEDKSIAPDLKQMIGEIAALIKEAKRQTGDLSDDSADADARETAWKAIVKDYVNTQLPTNGAFRAFIGQKEFGQDIVTQAPSTELQKLQNKAKQQAVDYVKALAALKSAKVDGNDKKAMKDAFEGMCVACDQIALINGMLDTVGNWRSELSGTPAMLQAYNGSALKPTMDALNDALSAENDRLARLQKAFERQVFRRA